jgi:hypothetical protein
VKTGHPVDVVPLLKRKATHQKHWCRYYLDGLLLQAMTMDEGHSATIIVARLVRTSQFLSPNQRKMGSAGSRNAFPKDIALLPRR